MHKVTIHRSSSIGCLLGLSGRFVIVCVCLSRGSFEADNVLGICIGLEVSVEEGGQSRETGECGGHQAGRGQDHHSG